MGHLHGCLDILVAEGVFACAFCSQKRDHDDIMLCCSVCHVSTFCNVECQTQAYKKSMMASSTMVVLHRKLCPLLREWKKVAARVQSLVRLCLRLSCRIVTLSRSSARGTSTRQTDSTHDLHELGHPTTPQLLLCHARVVLTISLLHHTLFHHTATRRKRIEIGICSQVICPSTFYNNKHSLIHARRWGCVHAWSNCSACPHNNAGLVCCIVTRAVSRIVL